MHLIGTTKNVHTRKYGAFYVFPRYFLLGTDAIKNISLIESAAALSSKSSPKCLLKKIDVITGEEAEYNVLKVCISYIALYRYKVALTGIKLSSTGTCFLRRQEYTFQKHRAA